MGIGIENDCAVVVEALDALLDSVGLFVPVDLSKVSELAIRCKKLVGCSVLFVLTEVFSLFIFLKESKRNIIGMQEKSKTSHYRARLNFSLCDLPMWSLAIGYLTNIYPPLPSLQLVCDIPWEERKEFFS